MSEERTFTFNGGRLPTWEEMWEACDTPEARLMWLLARREFVFPRGEPLISIDLRDQPSLRSGESPPVVWEMQIP